MNEIKKWKDVMLISLLGAFGISFAILSILQENNKIYMLLMLSTLSLQQIYLWNKNAKNENDKLGKFQLGTGIFIGIVVIIMFIDLLVKKA